MNISTRVILLLPFLFNSVSSRSVRPSSLHGKIIFNTLSSDAEKSVNINSFLTTNHNVDQEVKSFLEQYASNLRKGEEERGTMKSKQLKRMGKVRIPKTSLTQQLIMKSLKTIIAEKTAKKKLLLPTKHFNNYAHKIGNK